MSDVSALPLSHLSFLCRPGIALDHHLRPVIDNVETDLRVPGNSVNAVTKKLEHARIMADNQQILQRICKSKGQYSGMHCKLCMSYASIPPLSRISIHAIVLSPSSTICVTCNLLLQLINGNKRGSSSGSMQKYAGECSPVTVVQQLHWA